MLFNSLEFLIFLPIVFILYWQVFKKQNIQNVFLLVISYVFYGWWDWRFLILIAFTSLLSYYSGILIQKYDSSKNTKRQILTLSVVVNLLILGIFKYYNFFGENLEVLFAQLGFKLDWVTLKVLLPVGISFYTFQALSYSIDVYQKKIEPTKDIVAYFAFVSFFPQLVAGPIERATNLLPQFYKKRKFNYALAVDGLRLMLYGFFKKIIIADNAATCVNSIFSNYSEMPASSLWLAAILFSFQIYGDFSGYSDIAIGTSRLFGFNLMTNFKKPYFSRDIAEFWRKWHISLTTWFRDYLYIPLGGSRAGKRRALINTIIIFLVSGFWHGANWTFIVWGLLHAMLFIPLLLNKKNRKHVDEVGEHSKFPTFRELLQMLKTFVIVTFLWIVFRSDTITDTWFFILRMFDFSTITSIPSKALSSGWGWYVFLILFVIIEWLSRKNEHGFYFMSNIKNSFAKNLIYIVWIIILIYFSSGKPADFIYFQF
jgi:alginate O-acetyltransferase complex protein AlgI